MSKKDDELLDRLTDEAMSFFQPEEDEGDEAWDHSRSAIRKRFAAVLTPNRKP